MNNSNLKRISGLWDLFSKKGNKYLSFKIEGRKFMIFTNQFKQNKEHPDYILYEVIDVEKSQDFDSDLQKQLDIAFEEATKK